MVKVLLVVEDYGELVYLQTLLKKIGFDVEGAGSRHAVNEAILGFKPQVVLVSARGRKIDPGAMIEEIHAMNWGCRFIYIRTEARASVDRLVGAGIVQRVLSAPASVFDVVTAVAELAGLNTKDLEAKLHKLAQSKEAPDPEELVHVTGAVSSKSAAPHLRPQPYDGSEDPRLFRPANAEDHQPLTEFTKPKTGMSLEERRARYQESLRRQSPPTEANHLPSDVIREFNRRIRARRDTTSDSPFIRAHLQFITTLLKLPK